MSGPRKLPSIPPNTSPYKLATKKEKGAEPKKAEILIPIVSRSDSAHALSKIPRLPLSNEVPSPDPSQTADAAALVQAFPALQTSSPPDKPMPRIPDQAPASDAEIIKFDASPKKSEESPTKPSTKMERRRTLVKTGKRTELRSPKASPELTSLRESAPPLAVGNAELEAINLLLGVESPKASPEKKESMGAEESGSLRPGLTRQRAESSLPKQKYIARKSIESESQSNRTTGAEIVSSSPPNRLPPPSPYDPETAAFLLELSRVVDDSPPEPIAQPTDKAKEASLSYLTLSRPKAPDDSVRKSTTDAAEKTEEGSASNFTPNTPFTPRLAAQSRPRIIRTKTKPNTSEQLGIPSSSILASSATIAKTTPEAEITEAAQHTSEAGSAEKRKEK